MHLKTLLALTLTFLISAPLVFLLEVWLFDFASIVTARSILGIYVLYYALTLGEILLVNHFRRTSPASVLGIKRIAVPDNRCHNLAIRNS